MPNICVCLNAERALVLVFWETNVWVLIVGVCSLTQILHLFCAEIARMHADMSRKASAIAILFVSKTSRKVRARKMQLKGGSTALDCVDPEAADAIEDKSKSEIATEANNQPMQVMTDATDVGKQALPPEKSVSAHFDRVFWMGDFNYRIEHTRDYVDRCVCLFFGCS